MLFRYICCSAIAQTSEQARPLLDLLTFSQAFSVLLCQLLFVFSGESFYHLVSNLMPIQPDCSASFDLRPNGLQLGDCIT